MRKTVKHMTKKLSMKIIATILTFIMIFQFFPAIVLGVRQEENINTTIEYTSESTVQESGEEIVGEILERRTLNGKEFLLEDGTILSAIYPSNVHYEENGELLDIDNSLQEAKSEESTDLEEQDTYENKNNSFKIKFSKKTQNNLVHLKINNNNIKWSLKNSNKVTAIKNNELKENELENETQLKNIYSETVVYENILNNIDIKYTVISETVKEDIILKSKEAKDAGITFEFNIPNFKMEKAENGDIHILEENGKEPILVLDRPFMYDAQNEISYDIETIIEKQNNNKYTLTLKPSQEWLEAEDRLYPVTIDPTVSTSLNRTDIQDTFIFNGDESSTNRYNAHILRAGSNDVQGTGRNPTRTLIKFNIPQLQAGDQVIKAVFNLCSYPDTDEWAPSEYPIQLNLHKITADWNQQTASWSNMNTNYDTTIEDYAVYYYSNSDPCKFYDFDITSIVKDWYTSGVNYGLMLKDDTEAYNVAHSDAYFFSADINNAYTNARPIVQIVYRNQTGLEEYLTYHVQTVGRAGTVYTNDYNGNLTLIHPDAETPGTRLPANIYHVYNTNNKDEDWGYGKGNRLNLSQVILNETIDSVDYAKYTDEDGTKHYFKKDGDNYIDEDNLGLTLNFTNDNYYLKDKNGNKFTFIRMPLGDNYLWHLKEAEDSDGNKITLDLVTDQYVGARISKVTDGAGNSITISYNSSNRLSKITDVEGKSTNYTYNENGNLVQITYSDGKTSNYTYNSQSLLTQAKNIDNFHIDYDYHSEKANRLKSITEYSTQNELGNSLTIAYGNNFTRFVDNEGYSNNYTFNNWGQTISISDFGKEQGNVEKAYGKMYTYGTEGSNKNKLALEGKLISNIETENNLLATPSLGSMWGWDRMGYASSTDDNLVTDSNGNTYFRMNCDQQGIERIYQIVEVSGNAGDIFTASAWFNTNAVPTRDEREVGIYLRIIRTDNTEQIVKIPANVDGTGWQYVSGEFITDSAYSRIWYCLDSNYNANTTDFDCAGLFKEEYGQSYTYDSKGNLISTKDYAAQQNTFSYDSNDNLISAINPKGGSFTYTYDTTNPKRLISAVNANGNKYSFTYDNYGNITQSKVEDNSTSSNKEFIEVKAEYNSNGSYQTKIIDERENVTQYQYNESNGTVSKVIDPNNNETTYTYDSLNRVSTVSKQAEEKTYTNSYTYENDRLKTITHNGFTYTFVYDNFGNLKQTKVGSQVLSTKNYATNNGNLTSEIYGNNQTISYTYDRFDRTTKITGTNGSYEYTYDAKSNVKTIVDNINNNTETFTYDLAERLVKAINTNGFTSEYKYDINNNISNQKYTLNSNVNNVEYNFDKSNILTTLKLNNSITWTNTMDALARITQKKITSGSNVYTTNYTYEDIEGTENKTTTLLKTIKNGTNEEITYTYDKLGNIETIQKGTTQTNKYYYDELSQLIREDDLTQNKTITYEYDTGGNLLNKKEYAYTTTETLPEAPSKVITYAYGNTNWKDQLTSYDGKQITYDEIGNPLTYDGNTYTWQNGRKLAGISNTEKGLTTTYKYNDSGIRTQKTVNGTTTRYYLDGTEVVYEKTGENIIYYTYDENGQIIGLKYNDTQYYYIKNGQNDIIGILDSNFNQIVSYEYDSWGNILSIKDENGNEITSPTHIGLINSYRYRSYRYDSEIGLYYLNSRYYNPEWGRFINFDNYGGEVGELLSHNGYIYCTNNPVNMIDGEGNWPRLLAAVFIIIIVAITVTTIPQDTGTDLGDAITETTTAIGDAISTVITNISTNRKTKTQTVTQSTTKTKEKEKSNYWEAELVAGDVVRGKPIDYNEAVNRVEKGKNIMCNSQAEALGIAALYNVRKLDEPHGDSGYYWHYHINGKHGEPHIWFYGKPYLDEQTYY